MVAVTIFFYSCIFIFGIIIGSFLNVCILRIPLKETVVSKRSHCMTCGHTLAWYDLFPLFSWLFLRGKCRYCKAKISKQYPIVEATNGILVVLCFLVGGFLPQKLLEFNQWVNLNNVIEVYDWAQTALELGYLLLNAFVCSALLVITVVDWRTYEIPFGANVFIFVIGLIKLIPTMIVDTRYFDIYNTYIGKEVTTWQRIMANGKGLEMIIGFFAISVPLLIIFYASKGRAMGGGDVKLMAAAGFFLGWKLSIVAFMFGCIYACVIHIIRMKVKGEGSKLAMGPYLAAGILTAMWFGNGIVSWYAGFFS